MSGGAEQKKTVVEELGISNPIMYMDRLALIAGAQVGNTPKPSEVDGLIMTGLRCVEANQLTRACKHMDEAVGKAEKHLKITKAKIDVEKLAAVYMCRGYLALRQNQLRLGHDMYKNSIKWWGKLHTGEAAVNLQPLRDDLAKIRTKGKKKSPQSSPALSPSDSTPPSASALSATPEESKAAGVLQSQLAIAEQKAAITKSVENDPLPPP